jgi:hypothetical protein
VEGSPLIEFIYGVLLMFQIPLSSKEILKNFPYYSYVYLIQHKLTKRMYIGVRYCSMETRFHFIAIYDLRYYQTSSRDIIFSIELEDEPENFEYFILETFNNSTDARVYEAQLQDMFDASNNPLYYNMTNSDFTKGSMHDGIELYDLQNEERVIVSNIKKFNEQHGCSIYHIVKKDSVLIGNRFCRLDNIVKAKEYYILLNSTYTFYSFNELSDSIICTTLDYTNSVALLGKTFSALLRGDLRSTNGYYIHEQYCVDDSTNYTLYTFNTKTNAVEQISMRYKNGNKIVGNKFTELIKGTQNSTKEFYVSKELCELYNSTIKLYTFNDVKHAVELVEILYKNGNRLVGSGFSLLVTGKILTSKEFYSTYELCLKYNSYITLYYYGANGIVEHSIKYKDVSKLVGRSSPKLLDKSVNSINGFYLDKNLCEKDNTMQTLYYFNTYNNDIDTITFKHKQGRQIVGSHYNELIIGKRTYSNKFYLDKQVCLDHHKVITLYYVIDSIPKTIQIRYKDGPKLVGQNFSLLMAGRYTKVNGYSLIPY